MKKIKKEINALGDTLFTISNKRYCYYYVSKNNNSEIPLYKQLVFFKGEIGHRPCNEGPQYRDSGGETDYIENNIYHNLYGYASISKNENIYQYWIYGISYRKYEFNKYISIYNNLSYKRTY